MFNIQQLGTTLNIFFLATANDAAEITTLLKNGWPNETALINEIVLSALRILSVTMMTAATIFGFSAMHITQISQLISIFPTVIAPAISAIIVFHDLYVGSANNSESMTTPKASIKQISSSLRGRRSSNRKNWHFRNGKSFNEVMKEGATSFATELTDRMWGLKWFLVKTNRYWTPTIANRFYNANFKEINSSSSEVNSPSSI